MGVVGLDRNAVAAAAEDREALETWFLRKAWAAAVAAEGLALDPFNGGFEAARLLLLPNMSKYWRVAFTSANQGLMRISH